MSRAIRKTIPAKPGECRPRYREIYNKNANESPLLKLPAEVRNRIYEEVFGNKTIHLETRPCPGREKGAMRHCRLIRRTEPWLDRSEEFKKISYAVCTLEGSERDVYDLAKSCSSETGCRWLSIAPYDDRHKQCLDIIQELAGDLAPSTMSEEKAQAARDAGITLKACTTRRVSKKCIEDSALDLGLLRACRQIYHEATLIPYACNTFAFTDGYVMDMFLSGILTTPQREAIQSLQLGHWLREEEPDFDESSQTSLRRKTAVSLKSLESVEIALPNDGPPYGCIDVFAGLRLGSVRVHAWKYEWDSDIEYDSEDDSVGDHTQSAQRNCDRKCIEARQRAEALEELLKPDPSFYEGAPGNRSMTEDEWLRSEQVRERRRQISWHGGLPW